MTTWLIDAVAPRSTCSHCGSLNAEDQRVPVLPSVASAAGVPAFSVEDAVVGLPWESSVGAACAAVLVATSAYAARPIATTTAVIARTQRGRDLRCVDAAEERAFIGFSSCTGKGWRSEEHMSELQSHSFISY